MSVGIRLCLMLGLFGIVLVSCQAEKPEVVIVVPTKPVDQFTDRVADCAPYKPMDLVLRRPNTKLAKYEICQGPETRAELVIDNDKRTYVLLQQRVGAFDSLGQDEVAVLRPDQDAMQELGHFVIPTGSGVDPARVHDLWKAEVANSGTGIKIEFRATNGMVDHILHINPSSKTFADHLPQSSDAERGMAMVTLSDGSMPKGPGSDEDLAIRLTREGLSDLTLPIGTGYNHAQASRETDANGHVFVLLNWIRSGTGPLDELTLFHVQGERIEKLAEFHMSWALDGASAYVISSRVTRGKVSGLGLEMNGAIKGTPASNYAPPGIPSDHFWTVWFAADRG